ncbi:MAG: hypothetical protein WDN28_06800 [Chthoniobacter sp.]
MNKWLFLLLLIGLGGVGWVNRDKISARFGPKEEPEETPATQTPGPHMATPNPAGDSVARAKAMYPALAVPNSPFNRRFLELYNDKKTSDPAFLTGTDWPMLLAQKVATESGPAPSYQPPTAVSSSPLNGRPSGSAPASTVPPSVLLPGLKGSALDQRPSDSKRH